MPKPEKSAEPSMDEILASIRKIIAEEPMPAETPINHPEPTPNPASNVSAASAPPGADLSDILDEPKASRAPAAPSSPQIGLTEWSSANPVSRNPAPATDVPANPFRPDAAPDSAVSDILAADGKVPAGSTENEPDSPLVARLRDLATGGAGARDASASTVGDDQVKPTPTATEDSIAALAGSLIQKGATDKGPESSGAPSISERQSAPTADKPEPVTAKEKTTEASTSKAAVAASDPVSTVVEPAKSGSPAPADEPAGAASVTPVAAADAVAAPDKVVEGEPTGSAAEDATPSSSPPEVTMTELLRPIVSQWLDENLPAMIERAVEKKLSERS